MLVQLCVMERPRALACVPALDPLADRAGHPLDAGPWPERGLQCARTQIGRWQAGWVAGKPAWQPLDGCCLPCWTCTGHMLQQDKAGCRTCHGVWHSWQVQVHLSVECLDQPGTPLAASS